MAEEAIGVTPYTTMYGVKGTADGYQVVEVEARAVEGGWAMRIPRGRSVFIDFLPEAQGRLHATRELADARRAELQQALDALRDAAP